VTIELPPLELQEMHLQRVAVPLHRLGLLVVWDASEGGGNSVGGRRGGAGADTTPETMQREMDAGEEHHDFLMSRRKSPCLHGLYGV
jgi:hypothetical protein